MSSTIVLITGANSGVGFATAKVIASAAENYHVLVTGRTLAKVEAAIAELEASGIKGKLTALQLDVTDQDSVEAAVAYVQRTFGRLDVLINNAAIGGHKHPNFRTLYSTTMEVNVIGPAVVSESFRPLLLNSPTNTHSYSIYISSGAGSFGRSSDPTCRAYRRHFINEEAYRASKAALNMIALRESVNHKDTKLKVFVYSPGFVVSNLRGTSEEERTGDGKAGDPMVAGRDILEIVEGRRDGDAGKFLAREGENGGFYPW